MGSWVGLVSAVSNQLERHSARASPGTQYSGGWPRKVFEELDVGFRVLTLLRTDFPEPLKIFRGCVNIALKIQQIT